MSDPMDGHLQPVLSDDEIRALDDATHFHESLDWTLRFARAVEQRVLAALAAREGEPAVAVISECEACFTPDVCQLRGKCDYYAADRLRVAAAPTPPAEAVTGAMVAVARDAHRAAMLATNGDRVAAMRAAITAALAARGKS